MTKPTLPDSPIHWESAVQPPSHQDSEPLTRSPLRDARGNSTTPSATGEPPFCFF